MTQQPISASLSQELTLHCLDPHGRALDLAASFGYDPTDPYAVWITFPSPSGDVRWAMSRSVLLHGLTDPAGQGDLQLWPSIDEDGRAVVVLEFHSPDGRLVAQAHTHEVHRFLTRTLAVVPMGTESAHLDLDALVDSLLGVSGHPSDAE
ncbi:MAG: SsgA family sporulation/cell division regulator [Nocardioides sp.]